MTTFLRDLISVAIVLGIMIFVHEWGHFIAAKLCGVRVDVFSFGLGPRLFGVKHGDTDYRLSALPFGGYVRMAGDNVVEERTGADYEYLSKPRWQRVLVAVAGPAMNILLAFFIFWGIYWFVGIPYEIDLRQPADVVAVPQDSGTVSGVKPGDRILAVNGAATPTWDKVLLQVGKLKPGDSVSLTILRAAAEETLKSRVPNKPDYVDLLVGYPPLPAVVDDVEIGFPAEKAGMRSGDTVIAIDGKPVATWYQLVEAVHRDRLVGRLQRTERTSVGRRDRRLGDDDVIDAEERARRELRIRERVREHAEELLGARLADPVFCRHLATASAERLSMMSNIPPMIHIERVRSQQTTHPHRRTHPSWDVS